MNRCSACMTGFLMMVFLSGCSTLDCCHWWGRNTDGSSNLGKKAAPIQQGPIGGTFTNPGSANTTAPVQPLIQPAATPLVTTSPAQTYSPPIEQSSPAITPPSPPSPLQNTAPISSSNTIQMDNRTNSSASGSFPSNPSPASIVTELPENKPSIPSPVPPTPQVAGPTIPGQTRIESSPMPLLLAPQGSTSLNTAGNMTNQSAIAMPEIAVPTIAKPMDVAMPKSAGSGKNAGLNPGTNPPPLPPPPMIPTFDGKDRK